MRWALARPLLEFAPYLDQRRALVETGMLPHGERGQGDCQPEPDERHHQQTKEDAPAAGTPPLDEQILGELLQYAAFRLWVRHRHSA